MWIGALQAADAEQAQDLRLVPFPKRTTLESGRFTFTERLRFESSDPSAEFLTGLLNIELRRAGLGELTTGRLDSAVPAFRLAAREGRFTLPPLPQDASGERYSLDIRPDEIVCAAGEPAGLFYGLQTLCQLIRANRQDNGIACLKIQDWPSLRWRCFQDDMTRGASSKLDNLKFEASLASYLKLNLMTYYMEYQFAFKKYPQIGPSNGSLTPEELSALVAHAKPLHVDILGNQQSFGHFGQILKHPEFTGLRETPEVLTPVREETYQFLDDLYAEVCPLLPFPWFNVCCDETDGLGKGPSADLASKIGVGGVYVRHIQRVHDLLRERHHKRMMMWGDIILQHPDKLQEVPKDTIMLTWGYDARANFEGQIIPFSRSGYEFFVCPGVSDWSRILPDFGVAITNIQNFIRDGIKHGAIGMINTDWQDDGESLKAVKWHADAWAAECAWNGSLTSIEAFNRRLGGVLFGEVGDSFGKAIELLTETHRLPGMDGMFNARFWEKDFIAKSNPAGVQATASNLLAVVRPALHHLENCRRQSTCNQQVLNALQFGARRMEIIGQRMLDGLEVARLYNQVQKDTSQSSKLAEVERILRKNRDAHEQLGRQFAELWLSESEPYALDWTLRRYTNVVGEYDAILRRLETAQREDGDGKRLPPADEIGLATPKPLVRAVRPSALSTEPLSSNSKWLEPSATHRLGLTVQAGAIDRFDLPVEVVLRLPEELTTKPVRGFVVGGEEPREIPAQLDPLDGPDKGRLVVVLPGLLAGSTEASVHLYLGLVHPPSPPAGAVVASQSAQGMFQLENDQVRLRIGPEGAHVYRWDVKAAGNRDLTMPGESGWAGFSDLNAFRGSSYGLQCRARGPAMVEIECNGSSGHSKIVRLYAGASWMEVLLNEPTPVYWDYDNPINFAADGPTPGQWLFSDGRSGPVGRDADGVPAQVKAQEVYWSIKYNREKLALGLVTPGTAARHVVGPGAGAGGVGIEGSMPVRHFVTFAGVLTTSAAETMTRLQTTLNLKQPARVRIYGLQAH